MKVSRNIKPNIFVFIGLRRIILMKNDRKKNRNNVNSFLNGLPEQGKSSRIVFIF